MMYFGSSISPNLTKTEEGYLIAMNVPVARTGVQKYLPSEVPVDNPGQYVGADGLIPVYREPAEVFSSATIASFEGKPVSDSHPSTPDNKIHAEDVGLFGKGHIQNVRQGAGDTAENLVGDLIITDPALIGMIVKGNKREISCGYDCDWISENGKIYQRKITGNHVAVVSKGRAGSDVAIKDEKPKFERRITLAKENFFQRAFGLGLKEAIKDVEPEDVAELLNHGKEPGAKPIEDSEPAPNPVEAKLDKLIALFEKFCAAPKPETGAMDVLEEATKAEAEKEDEPLEQEESEKSKAIDADPEDQEDEIPAANDSAVMELVRQLKPSIAKIQDKAVRDSAAQMCLNALQGRAVKKGSVYGGINKVVQTNKAKAAQDTKPVQTVAEKNAAFVEACKKAAEK